MIRDARRDTLDTLECQDCGETLRYLTPAEAKLVSYSPYDYIVYCNDCLKDKERSND